MDKQLAKAVVVGGALPLAIAIVMQCGWPTRLRRLVGFGLGMVAGAVVAPQSRLAGGLLCATVARASYELLYEPTGIAATIERATTINIGSINTSNAAIGNGNNVATATPLSV